MIFYTHNFIPKKHAGCTRGFVIFIRPEYKNDLGLLEHEKVHRRQWLWSMGISSLLYLSSKRYRLWAEVHAYKVQLKFVKPIGNLPVVRKKFAQMISTRYKLNVTVVEAEKLLIE